MTQIDLGLALAFLSFYAETLSPRWPVSTCSKNIHLFHHLMLNAHEPVQSWPSVVARAGVPLTSEEGVEANLLNPLALVQSSIWTQVVKYDRFPF